MRRKAPLAAINFLPQHLYVHLPYCRQRCSYCSFVSQAVARVPEKAYYKALNCELDYRLRFFYEGAAPLKTVYFGGGTPSLFTAGFFADFIDLVARRLGLVADAEITVEVNPADVSPAAIAALRRAGVNRFSLGVQTFNDSGLKILGRRHDATGACRAIDVMRAAGVENLSLDLIYAWPGQTLAMLEADLVRLTEFSSEHVSAYVLSLEPGTRLADEVAVGSYKMPDEDQQLQLMAGLIAGLEDQGYFHYEISNFAREPGWRSRHNLAVWEMAPYIGLGAGACGCRRQADLKVERYQNQTEVDGYLEKLLIVSAGGLAECDQAGGRELIEGWSQNEEIDQDTFFRESLMLGLRLRQGVDLSGLRKVFGSFLVEAALQKAKPFLEAGMLARQGDYFRITSRGLFVSDAIIAALW